MSLKILIKQCKNNDRKAQRQLYDLYKEVLFGLCIKYCQNITEAEDVLQDSFISIFTKIHQYKGKGSFEGWLKRITINKAISSYHKNNFHSDNTIEDTLVFQETEIKIPIFTLDELLSMIQKLPNQYRIVFNLYELDNFSHQEIASMLGISVNTSKSNLHRAKQQLKKLIQKTNKSLQEYG